MENSDIEKSRLFQGVPAEELSALLENTPHHIRKYDKEETIFRLMDPAEHVGVILKGRVEAQKSFPNGSQVNVSGRGPGDLIGPAAVFSASRRYPCDMVALEPATVMMFEREDLLRLMHRDIRIMENLITEISSSTYMLQQRLELFSYSGIAQKAAFWLLMQKRQTGKDVIALPGSVTKWAMLMNVSRSSLHREMKRMETEGLIRCSARAVEILDAGALQEVLG